MWFTNISKGFSPKDDYVILFALQDNFLATSLNAHTEYPSLMNLMDFTNKTHYIS